MPCTFCELGICTVHQRPFSLALSIVSHGKSDYTELDRKILEDSQSKWANKKLSEKKKTGDKEVVALILEAWGALDDYGEGYKGARLDYGKLAVNYEKGDTTAFVPIDELNIAYLTEPSRLRFFGTTSKHTTEDPLKLREKLVDLQKSLSKVSHGTQFVVNLALLNFRTAGGGRLRKSRSGIRGESEDEYARPFYGSISPFVTFMTAAMKGSICSPPGKLSIDVGKPVFCGALKQTKYVPPVRFTVSFFNPKGKTGINDFSGSYSHLGSFGFAEPSFSYWAQGYGGGEYPGLRLSLGAYGLNPKYLVEVKDRVELDLKDDSSESALAYVKYGGASHKHLKFLLERFGVSGNHRTGSNGLRLSAQWVAAVLRVSSACVTLAGQQCKPLAGFFSRLRTKISKRKDKLRLVLGSGGKLVTESGLEASTLFDKVWVLESTLWEFMFLGASLLSMDDIIKHITRDLAYTPAMGASEDALVEAVMMSELDGFARVLFPSGTSAAEQLHALLGEAGYPHITESLDAKQLSAFRPYFEFYIPGSEPKDQDVGTPFLFRTSKSSKTGALWINLSENLHGWLMGQDIDAVGKMIGEQVYEYVQLRAKSVEQLVVVVDFTKFCGEMPNHVVYHILFDLGQSLSKVCELVFLRSNLKYNSGSLDRYQSGEVLIPSRTAKWLKPESLGKKSAAIFSQDKGGWNLFGEYVSLMRKTYLLADYIHHLQWRAYINMAK